jgi:hypothetical protein
MTVSCANNKSSALTPDFYEKCRQLVLSENTIEQKYIFTIQKEELDELHVTYLGYIITKNKDTLKIVNSINYVGLYKESPRAHGAFFLYQKNRLLGKFYVGGALEVPSRIEQNNLVFDYHNEWCNQKTVIDLSDSIPTQLFINCTETGGDLYNFSKCQ